MTDVSSAVEEVSSHEAAQLLARAALSGGGLGCFSHENLDAIATEAQFARLREGDAVFLSGELATFVVVVLSGSIQIRGGDSSTKFVAEPSRAQDQTIVRRGRTCGELEYFEPGLRSADCVSKAPGTLIMVRVIVHIHCRV